MGALKFTRRFITRSARYALEDHDTKLVRIFPADGKSGPIFDSECVDVSESGMRFVLRDEALADRVGERVQMEFFIPKTNQRVTGIAEIVRVDDLTQQWVNKPRHSVAVQFTDMAEFHRKALIRAVAASINEQAVAHLNRQVQKFFGLLRRNAAMIALVILSTLLFGSIMFLLTFNDDPARKTVWGTRFSQDPVVANPVGPIEKDNFLFYKPTAEELQKIHEQGK